MTFVLVIVHPSKMSLLFAARLDVLGNRMIGVMNNVIKLLLGNYSSTKCRMLEVILELGLYS